MDPGRALGVRLVHRAGLGGADPGAAQPDDPVADHRHRGPGAVAFQRRPGAHPRDGHARRAPDAESRARASGARSIVLDHSQATAADQTAEPAASGRSTAARRALGVLRRNWPAAALLTVGLVLRVLAELAYRPALFYIDSPRYLFNAEGMDPVGYKGP